MNGPLPPDHDIPADLAAAFPDAGAVADSGDSPEDLLEMRAVLAAETGRRWRGAELSTPIRWAVAVALVGVVCTVVLLKSSRADLHIYPGARMLADLVLLALPLLAGLGLALRPLSRPAATSRVRMLAAVVGSVCIGVLLSLPMAHSAHPASIEGAGDDFVPRAVACFVFGLVYAGLALLGLRALARHRGRWWPGAAMLGTAGGVGMLALYLHCPITHTVHLWAGHGTVAAVVCVGMLLLRRRLDG